MTPTKKNLIYMLVELQKPGGVARGVEKLILTTPYQHCPEAKPRTKEQTQNQFQVPSQTMEGKNLWSTLTRINDLEKMS